MMTIKEFKNKYRPMLTTECLGLILTDIRSSDQGMSRSTFSPEDDTYDIFDIFSPLLFIKTILPMESDLKVNRWHYQVGEDTEFDHVPEENEIEEVVRQKKNRARIYRMCYIRYRDRLKKINEIFDYENPMFSPDYWDTQFHQCCKDYKKRFTKELLQYFEDSKKPITYLELLEFSMGYLEKEREDYNYYSKKYYGLYERLNKKVISQDIALQKFVKGLYTADISKGKRKDMPYATFLLAGPPGVGKTYLASILADELKRPFKIFAMTEYADHQSWNGLVGFDKTWKDSAPGVLTTFVSKNPDAILIFDEIEKAHANTIRQFLSVLEGGYLDDINTEKRVDFSNTICIFTTNAGRDFFAEHRTDDISSMSEHMIVDAMEQEAKDSGNDKSKEGLSVMPPEMLSRLRKGNIIAFNYIDSVKLLPLVKKGLKEGVESVKTSLKVRMVIGSGNSDDVEKLSYLFLYHMGSRLDARIASSRSKSFISDIVYETLGANESKKYDEEKLPFPDNDIKITIDENDELYKELLGFDLVSVDGTYRKPEVLFLGVEDIPQISEVCINVANHLEINIDDAEAVGALVANNRRADVIFVKPEVNDELVPILKSKLKAKIIAVMFEKLQDRPSLYECQKLKEIGYDDVCFIADDEKRDEVIEKEVYNAVLSKKLWDFQRNGRVLEFKKNIIVDGSSFKVELCDYRKEDSTDAEASKYIASSSEKSSVRFADIIGAEDASERMQKYVKFLKDPDGYRLSGAKPSKGILLYGPPGTGKTMLAKALASEADCPFIAVSGADFLSDEADAPTIKKIFSIAKQYSPAVVFIDEIDAFARPREERGNTKLVNQLLTEMDGFSTDESKPVYVVAATNAGGRHDLSGENINLDAAVLRRFSDRCYVGLPGRRAMEEYLKMKVEKLSVAKGLSENQIACFNVEEVAYSAIGYNLSLSDMDTIFNSVLSDKYLDNDDEPISNEEIISAMEQYKMGPETLPDRKDKYFDAEEHREKLQKLKDSLLRTARHEAGHAMMAYDDKYRENPAYMVIKARGEHRGFVRYDYDELDTNHTKAEMLAIIRSGLAGRGAEMLFYGNDDTGISTGAASDLKSASQIALRMLTRYGMGETLVSYAGTNMMPGEAFSEANRILEEQNEIVDKYLKYHKSVVDALAHGAMERGYMTGSEIDAYVKAFRSALRDNNYYQVDCPLEFIEDFAKNYNFEKTEVFKAADDDSKTSNKKSDKGKLKIKIDANSDECVILDGFRIYRFVPDELVKEFKKDKTKYDEVCTCLLGAKKYYAVKKGYNPGIYKEWYGSGEAADQVKGFSGPVYRKFASLSETLEFMKK